MNYRSQKPSWFTFVPKSLKNVDMITFYLQKIKQKLVLSSNILECGNFLHTIANCKSSPPCSSLIFFKLPIMATHGPHHSVYTSKTKCIRKNCIFQSLIYLLNKTNYRLAHPVQEIWSVPHLYLFQFVAAEHHPFLPFFKQLVTRIVYYVFCSCFCIVKSISL